MRYAITGVIVGAVVALLLSLHAVGHALPAPYKKPWSEWTLTQKETYVRSNLRHARGVIGFAASHRESYRPATFAHVLRQHRALERKASANLKRIREAMLPHSIRGIICYVWGDQCSNALAVVQCESNFDIYNQTGDYWGLFQFGSEARSEYGFAWDAWTQTRAAKALFDDRWWYPWECAGPGFLGYF